MYKQTLRRCGKQNIKPKYNILQYAQEYNVRYSADAPKKGGQQKHKLGTIPGQKEVAKENTEKTYQEFRPCNRLTKDWTKDMLITCNT